ncbi:uncharacterized protein LOC143658744 [Tamandua tetradactyla]|uniref:uncharacterized protein LOC143658744 n=1 Tax=Tamandua tetradactyla TaxID=48850 RepID=UPI0040545FEE
MCVHVRMCARVCAPSSARLCLPGGIFPLLCLLFPSLLFPLPLPPFSSSHSLTNTSSFSPVPLTPSLPPLFTPWVSPPPALPLTLPLLPSPPSLALSFLSLPSFLSESLLSPPTHLPLFRLSFLSPPPFSFFSCSSLSALFLLLFLFTPPLLPLISFLSSSLPSLNFAFFLLPPSSFSFSSSPPFSHAVCLLLSSCPFPFFTPSPDSLLFFLVQAAPPPPHLPQARQRPHPRPPLHCPSLPQPQLSSLLALLACLLSPPPPFSPPFFFSLSPPPPFPSLPLPSGPFSYISSLLPFSHFLPFLCGSPSLSPLLPFSLLVLSGPHLSLSKVSLCRAPFLFSLLSFSPCLLSRGLSLFSSCCSFLACSTAFFSSLPSHFQLPLSSFSSLNLSLPLSSLNLFLFSSLPHYLPIFSHSSLYLLSPFLSFLPSESPLLSHPLLSLPLLPSHRPPSKSCSFAVLGRLHHPQLPKGSAG